MDASSDDNNFSGLGMIDVLLNDEWMNQNEDGGYADVVELFEEEGIHIFSGEFNTMVPSNKGDGSTLDGSIQQEESKEERKDQFKEEEKTTSIN